jgi:2-keto-4-pentenoate hydratase/2-oxohepta-3-ene-1,7-dioic acid hydratase in catechol pathway
MKFGRIALPSPDGKVARLVAVEPEKGRVIDLARAAALNFADKYQATEEAATAMAKVAFPGSLVQALSLGTHLTDRAGEVVSRRGDDASFSLNEVEWLPASDAPLVRDTLNFVGHIKGFHDRMGTPPSPSLLKIPAYTKNSGTMVIGQNATVPWPGYINYMDYELELGFVVGLRGRNLDPESARKHLFGITIYNDFSGRDLQGNEMPILMGATKSKDFAHAIGPWITTIDEFESLDDISMEVRVNGEVITRTNSSGTLWSVYEQLAYISLGEYIQPGDVIGSGTVGNGSFLEKGRQLSPGDVVEMEVGGVGVLRNTLGPKQDGLWWPSERPDGSL